MVEGRRWWRCWMWIWGGDDVGMDKSWSHVKLRFARQLHAWVRCWLMYLLAVQGRLFCYPLRTSFSVSPVLHSCMKEGFIPTCRSARSISSMSAPLPTSFKAQTLPVQFSLVAHCSLLTTSTTRSRNRYPSRSLHHARPGGSRGCSERCFCRSTSWCESRLAKELVFLGSRY